MKKKKSRNLSLFRVRVCVCVYVLKLWDTREMTLEWFSLYFWFESNFQLKSERRIWHDAINVKGVCVCECVQERASM